MRIVFNGTGIRVYGAKRDNHGAFSAKLDDGTPQLLSGLGDAALQALLYQVGGLPDNKQHELVRQLGREGVTVFAELTPRS